ncbi:YigZ family protein [Thermanaerosceptrum fracticalcis]
MNKRYRDATHNVFAYRLLDGQERCSDDGELSGTAGKQTFTFFNRKTGV